MARIPYVSRHTIPDGRTDLYDRLLAERGPNPENIFLALANAPALTEAVLGMATALRKQTSFPRVFRELAVVTVGIVANAPYEVDHHWNAALGAGVRREQLESLQDFEESKHFTAEERAVIRLAREVTLEGHVDDSTWDATAFLGPQQRLELLLTIAWYNCVVRILLPLQIEKESWFVRQ
ncbi:carboxymuconolactone decarboxylase family protein [Paraburkholderia madseniana]|uniref:carboxymuconolactone decarboxylase family protein n=1 Tax=Paraburkholderia madseniana TaxID=2599607 RepID=UPI0038BBAC4E